MANHYTDIYASYQPDIYPSSADLSHLNPVHGESLMQSQLGMSKDNRVLDTAQDNFGLMPYPDTFTTPSPSSLGAPTSTEGPGPSSSPHFLLPDMLDAVHPASSQTRKPRRDKPRIDLAPDQPPTSQGRRRARVFVACLQCRSRKIRCDGAKPKCFHCSQREENDECTYDTLPKRRGPDKIRGARSRAARPDDDGDPPPRRRRRHLPTVDQAASGSYGITQPSVSAKPSKHDTLKDSSLVDSQPHGVLNEVDPGFELLEGSELFGTTASHNEMFTVESGITEYNPSFVRVVEYENTDEATYHTTNTSVIPEAYIAFAQHTLELDLSDITPDPSLQFSRETWFEHISDLYAVLMPVSRDPSLELTQYDGGFGKIMDDVRFIFRFSPYWFSFLNVPRFYNNLMDPYRRSHMQPSLLLALLAVSKCLQSAGQESSAEVLRVALLLRDEAQGYLEASLHARAIDVELAEAAWVLSFFEVCAHPRHQKSRIHSALDILDSIIRLLGITYLDANDPAASTFTLHAVPAVDASSEQYFSASQSFTSSMSIPSPTQQGAQQQQSVVDTTTSISGCSCDAFSLGSQWPEAQSQVPGWLNTPMWNAEWTEGEIKKEECRRLCWSTLMLVSGHTSYSDAVNWRLQELFTIEPSNYSILFPGESLLPLQTRMYSNAIGGKNTVWALYLRAMLLWNGCVRMRHDTGISDYDRRDFAMRAWIETEAIEKALQRHTCRGEGSFMYHGREILFNTRMCISYEFQRFVPHVLIGLNRRKAEEWLRGQGKRATAVISALHTITGNKNKGYNILQRPWFMWWYMGQVYRALTLWEHDNSLTIAIDVCKAFFEPIEYLIKFFPGPAQERRLRELRARVFAAEAASSYVLT